MKRVSKETAVSQADLKTDVRSHNGIIERIRGLLTRRSLIGGTGSQRMDERALSALDSHPTQDVDSKGISVAGTAIAKVAFVAAVVVGFAYLFELSLYLAAMLQYQVNECANVFSARLLASGSAVPGANLFQILLSWLSPNAVRSADLFASARLIMVVLFWANCLLITLAAGERLLTFRWWVALAGAASLAPFWHCGLGIRPDNLLLSGVLLIWASVRFRPATATSYAFAGAIAASLTFVSAEGLFYALAISLSIICFPPSGGSAARWKVGGGWVSGAVGTFLLYRLVLGATRAWPGLGAATEGFEGIGIDRSQAGLGLALAELSRMAPLLWTLVASALITVGLELRRHGKAALSWNGMLPEALLFALLLVALSASGRPLSASLSFLSPFAFLLGFRHAAALWKRFSDHPATYPILGAVLVFTHLIPFTASLQRERVGSNARQEVLMNYAEEIAAPGRDSVYDGGIGMVPTRQTLAVEESFTGALPGADARGTTASVAGLPVTQPAVAVVCSYRTDRLPPAVQTFIREHYVPLADDFQVLGTVLPPSGGTFQILHPGRYRIAPLAESNLAGTYSEGWQELPKPEKKEVVQGTLDGILLTSQQVDLAVGWHRLETAVDCQPTVVWIGPTLDSPRRLGQSDRRWLFRHGYW